MKGRFALAGTVAGVTLALGVVGANGQSTTATPTISSITLTATLSSAEQVPAPKNAPRNATATFTATVKGMSMTWKLSFAHLGGAATAADINQGALRATGPVVVKLCAKCKSKTSGRSSLAKAALVALEHGDAYVDIHTKQNAKGELRGQLTVHS